MAAAGRGKVAGELWNGADVRWVGPTRMRGDVQLRRDDRAVVVDAGRHHISSYATLSAAPARRPAWGRGVVIRVEGGREVAVAARHLALVAPDHPLRPEHDGRQADWWLSQLGDWDGPLPVSSFVPHTLPAVCRVLHPWVGPGERPVRWREAAADVGVADRATLARRLVLAEYGNEAPVGNEWLGEPDDGHLDRRTAAALIDVLANATETPDDVFVAVWVGWGDTPPERFPGAARLETPGRGHFLLRGPLDAVHTGVHLTRRRGRRQRHLVAGGWRLAGPLRDRLRLDLRRGIRPARARSRSAPGSGGPPDHARPTRQPVGPEPPDAD